LIHAIHWVVASNVRRLPDKPDKDVVYVFDKSGIHALTFPVPKRAINWVDAESDNKWRRSGVCRGRAEGGHRYPDYSLSIDPCE
jgi:hypothetical protein